jgi:hypothetical protein
MVTTKVINKKIFVELLGIREESVMLYLWGMNPLAYAPVVAKVSQVNLVHSHFCALLRQD